MVSLRSGSTTDNKETGATAEVSSTRRGHQTTGKQDSRLTKSKADEAKPGTATAKKSARSRLKILAPIAEASHSGLSAGEFTIARSLVQVASLCNNVKGPSWVITFVIARAL